MKRYHFISGLPRSGSTLLSTILNQNPNFHADISSPLARFVRAIITESHGGPGYHLQCPEEKRIKLIQNLIETYHSDINAEVCFNTNRGWTALIDALTISNPNSKIICCVRSIPEILDSFEVLFRKNPFSISKLYSSNEAENVFTRCDAQMSPGHTLRFAYDSLREAIAGNNANKIMLVEYDQLAKFPEQTMKALYTFIKEPYFEHDFENVEGSFDEFDNDAIMPGLHKIRKGVSYVERQSILPKEIIQKYSGLEGWR